MGGAPTNAFIHELAFEELPAEVVAQDNRGVLDLIGVAVSGRQTELSRIVHDFAASQMGASTGGARPLFDGRRASVTGAAFAGASTFDSFDAHDGHRLTKGHAGVAVLPACRFAEQNAIDGREFVTCLVLGYEIATRAAWCCTRPRATTPRALVAPRSARAFGSARTRRVMRLVSPSITAAQPDDALHRPSDHEGRPVRALAGVSAACLAADGYRRPPC